MVQLAAGCVIDGYEIIRSLGKGGMGYVVLARQLSVDREVALKMIATKKSQCFNKYADRLMREACTVAQLNHRNIISVHDVVRSSVNGTDIMYFSMEYVNGVDLWRAISKTGRLSPEKLLDVLLSIADALSYAHSRGMVHRDIKPANIILTSDGQPKLADFGLALDRNNPSESDLDEDGKYKISGTPYYMSPEQVRGREATPQSDMYALGATLYFLLTSERPFQGDTVQEILEAHLHAPVPDPASKVPCSDFLRNLCTQLMAKSPGDRPTAEELKEMIRSSRQGVGSVNGLEPAVRSASKSASRSAKSSRSRIRTHRHSSRNSRCLHGRRSKRSRNVQTIVMFGGVALLALLVVFLLQSGAVSD